MFVLTVANQKGGVGKTTTAEAAAAYMKSKGARVLVIDLDPQGNLTFSYNARDTDPSIKAALEGSQSLQGVIQQTARGDIAAASESLATLPQQTPNRLKELLAGVVGQYDAVVIDTPPTLSTLTVMALTASQAVVIPASADVFSFRGLDGLLKTVGLTKAKTNPDLDVAGVVFTRFNPRTILSRDLLEEFQTLAAVHGVRIFETKIRDCNAIKEAQALRKDIFTHAPKSNASEDYKNLLNEFLE